MSARTDGVRLAVFSNRLEGISRKMSNTLLRTGRSGVLNIARDFSCCIVTAGDELIAAAESLPIHVLSGPDLMARSLKEFHPVLHAGDAFLHNSPYHGNSHAADHVLLVPVVDPGGTHRFTLVVKAHQADVGNSIPTTYHGTARDVYEEGALIFAATQVQRDYRNLDDIIRMCRLRIRVPDQWWGDYLAMVGAARIGERELLSFAEEVGWDALDSFGAAWMDYAERRMVDAIRALPHGRATRTSIHDPVPGTPPEGVSVTATVDVDPGAARITVDLTQNGDCLPCGLNLSEACARTSAMVGVFNSLDPEVPKNAGAFRRLDIRLRENCVVGIPRHPTSTSVATTNVADRVANAVQAAMAELGEGNGMAECGAITPPSSGVISGVDARTGGRYVNQIFLGLTGGAAGPVHDAWQTIGHVGNGGLIFIDSVELDELRQPIEVVQRRILPDTEGAGRTRGASSVLVEFGPVGGPMAVAYVNDGEINAPLGVRGGGTGGASAARMVRRNAIIGDLPNCGVVEVLEGERIVSVSTGGGGYGPPTERPPEKVAADVREGWISPARAASIYGVVLNATGTVDQAATAAQRKGMA